VDYSNRGNARRDLDDKQAAITDYDLGDKQAAIADYDQAIKLNPDYASAYNNRGRCLFSAAEFRPAEVNLASFVRIYISLQPLWGLVEGWLA
jgi:tetratricopeptide (TPR) repeat protein